MSEFTTRWTQKKLEEFEEIDANLSMDELICKMECPSFFINQHQSSSIIDFDSR